MSSFLFDLLTMGTLISGILVITSNNPVNSVVFLIAVFIQSACLIGLLGIGFVGLTYLIVYVGAVAVLFLFVILILNVRISEIVSVGLEYSKNLPLGGIISIFLFLELISILPSVINLPNDLILNVLITLSSYLFNINSSQQSIFNLHKVFSGNLPDVSFLGLSQVQSLGITLYTYGSLWLFIISIVLLLAIIGPIALCIKIKENLRTPKWNSVMVTRQPHQL